MAVTACLVALACGCQPSHHGPPTPAPPPIRLGALVPLTGDSAPTGQAMVAAFTLAINQANAAGGVLGRRVELVTADDGCDPQTAVGQANLIVTRGITVSVGGYCSSATVPTLKIFRDAGIPMVIPAANSTDLTASGYDSIFLLSGTSATEARQAVSWMPTFGARRVAVVHDGTSFPEAIANATRQAATPASGVTVTGTLRLIQGAPSYDRITAQILAINPDTVFYTGYYAEAGRLIGDLRQAGYTGKIMLSDAATGPQLFQATSPQHAEGARGITLPQPQLTPGLAAWSASYRALCGHDPGPFTMQAYDAVRLALDAIGRAGTLDHAAVRAALSATTPADVTLLSGQASFNPDGTQRITRYTLLRAHAGAFVADQPAS